jgi:hypothetical protein
MGGGGEGCQAGIIEKHKKHYEYGSGMVALSEQPWAPIFSMTQKGPNFL